MAVGDSIFLYEAVIVGVCDLGDCGQGNEFEWKAYYKENNVDVANRKLYVNGVPSETSPYEGFTWDYYLIDRRPRLSNQRIDVLIIESDRGADDELGYVSLTSSSFGSDGTTLLTGRGTLRCDWPSNFGYVWLCGSYTWRETNQRFRRTLNP